MTNEATVFGWHWTNGKTLRDGRPLPPVGEWLVHEGPTVICESGLHGSRRILDALRYAPGSTVHYCEFADVVDEQDDKLVSQRRRILWSLDVEAVLRAYARRVALDVADLWDCPPVVRKYLETGREDLRAAAWSAARSAAWSAARSAARSAVWSAARSAAGSAAWYAAWDAAGYAAWDAAGSAAWDKYNGWLEEMVRQAAGQEVAA